MKKITFIGLFVLSVTPFIAAAQNLSSIQTLVASVGNIVRMLIPILVALAVVVFFWGLIRYIRGSGKDHTEGRNIMIAGLVSIFVMVCLWGIIGFSATALGINTNQAGIGIPSPTVTQ
jgi:hypothetical protein